MKVKLKTDEYTIFERRDGRFAIKDAKRNAINGDDKIEILLQNDLIATSVSVAEKSSPVDETKELQSGEKEGALTSPNETDAEDAGVVESAGEEADTEADADSGLESEGKAGAIEVDTNNNEQSEEGEDRT